MNEQDKARAQRFGAYIKALRLAHGLTQQELSDKCGYAHRAAISQLEAGKNDIAFDRLPVLSAALGVEPQELFNVYAGTTDKDNDNLVRLESVKSMLNELTPLQLEQVAAIVKVMYSQNKGGTV